MCTTYVQLVEVISVAIVVNQRPKILKNTYSFVSKKVWILEEAEILKDLNINLLMFTSTKPYFLSNISVKLPTTLKVSPNNVISG